MEYQLLWLDRLWTVVVPPEVPEASRWLYVQAFVTSDGSKSKAMTQCLQTQYPGLGFTNRPLQPPVPFSSVCAVPASPAVEADAFVSYTSSPASVSNTYSHRPTPRPSSPAGTNGGSGSGAPRRHPPRPATSTGGLGQRSGGSGRPPPQTKRHATQGTGGWMGSATTSA